MPTSHEKHELKNTQIIWSITDIKLANLVSLSKSVGINEVVCYEMLIPLWLRNGFLEFHHYLFFFLLTTPFSFAKIHSCTIFVWIVSDCVPCQTWTCSISLRQKRDQRLQFDFIIIYFYCSENNSKLI